MQKPYEVSICQLGIMGTKYVFDGPPPPDKVEIVTQETKNVTVSKIYPELEIGNHLNCRIRQQIDNELSWVYIM